MSKIKVNSIVDRHDEGAPTLDYGATIPSGETLFLNGNINVSGISTVGFVTVTNVSANIITAGTFVGDGSTLQNVPSVSESKSFALKIVLDPLPFRS